MATTKFKILGTMRIKIPAISAIIGCNIIAFKVKVIGLHSSSYKKRLHGLERLRPVPTARLLTSVANRTLGPGRSATRPLLLEGAKMAARQPHNQQQHQDKSESAADAITAAPAI